jgi:hypothetical protein
MVRNYKMSQCVLCWFSYGMLVILRPTCYYDVVCAWDIVALQPLSLSSGY